MRLKNLFRKDYKTQLNAPSGSITPTQPLPFAVAIRSQLRTTNDAYSRYRLCDDVRGAVDMVADGMMMVDLRVTDSQGQEVPKHPLQVLLNFINNSQPAKDFYREVFTDFLLSGETFLRKVKTRNTTIELEHIPSSRMELQVEGSQLVYIVTDASGGMTRYQESEDVIVHIHTALLDKIRSSSPLESIASLIDASISSDMIASAMAKSGIYKNFFRIGYDTATQHEVIKQVMNDISSIENAGGILPIPMDIQFELVEAKNGLESAFNETIDKLISSAVAKVYHIPTDFLTSSYVQGKYQQAEVNTKRFYENAVLPQIRLIVEFLNFALANKEYPGFKIVTSTENIPELSVFNTVSIADFNILAEKINSRAAYEKVFNQSPGEDVTFKDETGA